MPGTGSATGTGADGGGGTVTSSHAPAWTRSDLAGTDPSTSTSPAEMSSAARVRENPKSRARAASRRSPSRPSGTGSVRRSLIDGLLGLPAAVDLVTAPGEEHRENAAADDRRVGQVEHREPGDGERLQEVDHVP